MPLLATGWTQRGQQRPRAMSQVFLLALFGLAGLRQLRGIVALHNLHARLFVSADHQAALLIQAQSLAIQGTDCQRFLLEARSMTVQPTDVMTDNLSGKVFVALKHGWKGHAVLPLPYG